MTGQATAWNPDADRSVTKIVVRGSTVYACGLFYDIGGQSRFTLAALDATTGLATSWNPQPGSNVMTIVAGDGLIYCGGFFLSVGGQPRNHIAAVDSATGLARSASQPTTQKIRAAG